MSEAGAPRRARSIAPSAARLPGAVARLPRGRWVVAVSGGRDSMALLDAMVAARGAEIAVVATFDHGTGVAARDACALVMREATARGLPVVQGHMNASDTKQGRGEAHWRAARWRFLSRCARERDGTVVTAHTRDDQVETVLMRLLRGAGPRGLAAMRAGSRPEIRPETSPKLTPRGPNASGARRAIVRPLLDVSRADVAAYALSHGVPFVEDPSNTSMRFLRNRVRHQLLPALEQAVPGFAEWCLSLASRAAHWRAEVDDLAAALSATPVGGGAGDRSGAAAVTGAAADSGAGAVSAHALVIDAKPVAALREAEWQVLWPAFAARAGVTMDRRGLVRASAWAPRAAVGSRIPLSGDARIERTASTFIVRRGSVSEGDAGTP